MQSPLESARPGSPPRVLMIAATYPPTRCGVGDYVRRLAAELVAQGSSVWILTGVGEDPQHQHGEGAAMNEVTAPPRLTAQEPPSFTELPDGVQLSRCVEQWDWSALDHLAAALRVLRPDVVSLQYHGEDYLLHPAICTVPALAQASAVPTVTTLHNLQAARAWPGGPDPLGALLGESRMWITTNALDRGRLLELPESQSKLREITAGPCITAPAERRPLAAAGFHCAYFGFLNPFKGIEYLLRAVARVRAEGEDIRMTLAAGIHTDAPTRLCDYAGFIDDEIERLALGSMIDRRGFLPDEEVSVLLLECHLAAFPFRDGLSGKNSSFWSTLHHGTPALTTRGPGLPQGLIDGENVLLAEIDDEESLADRIRWAMAHREDLSAIGEAGRRHVHERFDWGRLARATQECFEESMRAAARGEA